MSYSLSCQGPAANRWLKLSSQFDAFIHMYVVVIVTHTQANITDLLISDAMGTHFVYDWRQEQERTLLATTGKGMTVEQVKNFVDGCTYHTSPIGISLWLV